MDSSRYAELFLTESQEHLSAINHSLLELERAPGAAEPVDALFRAMHTIKGMAATMGYAAVTELSHELETMLDLVRRGALRVDGAVTEGLFKGADALELTIDEVSAGKSASDVSALVEQLRGITAAARRATPTAGSPTVADPARGSGGGGPSGRTAGTIVRIRLEADTPLKGVRAFMISQAATALGNIIASQPEPEALQAEQFDREFVLIIATTAGVDTIERVIRSGGFVEHVTVEAQAPLVPKTPEPIHTAPSAIPIDATGEHPVRGPGATDVGVPGEPLGLRQHKHVRIDLRRLDTLMNQIGELVISRGRLQVIAADIDNPVLDEALTLASRLISDLQDEIMTSRLVPVWQVFDRFPRLVRDAARSLGKDVDFVIEGKDIELDRSMLDEIGEPVVHLLRNAVDHGLESPADRRAAGKPPAGKLRLAALRDRSSVLIRVTDDGRGVDKARVMAKAKRLGLVDAGRSELTDEEIFRLIARPGFSTAEKVTDLSGRGVGIDAVATRVRALGGSLEMKTTEGEGTTVTARLPVTLAIVRAVLAKVDDETYAVPMTHVSETLELAPGVADTVKGREVLSFRGELVPRVKIRAQVRLPRQPDRLSHVIVLEIAEKRAGILVDRLLGQQDIVVKQFDGVRDGLALFSGATILGDGAPALILDVGTLL